MPSVFGPSSHRPSDLVPLSVAATVTYFTLASIEQQLEDRHTLAQALVTVAVALSEIAPLRVRDAPHSPPLTREQVRTLFLEPMGNGDPPDLDRFALLRSDLGAAIARMRYSPPSGLTACP